MSIELTSPGALWLLLVLPVIWLAIWVGRTNFNRRQRLLQAGIRSLILALLAVVLARPVISRQSSETSIVYLVDVSHSIASRAITGAADRIDGIQKSLNPSHSRIVAFGGDAASVPDTAALRALAQQAAATGDETDAFARESSDLERAFAEARAELAPGFLPRIVLFTDGRPTGGDLDAAVTRLASEGVPVFVEAMAVRDLGDAWVDAVEVPERVPAGALVPVTVAIGSQRAEEAMIELTSGDTVLGRKAARLEPGTTMVAIDVTFAEPGTREITAVVTADKDPLVANNRAGREVVVEPRARVLYVEGAPSSAKYLQGALTQAGFDVAVLPPAALAKATEDLDPWDVVVLSDVARESVPDTAMASLSSWVEQRGGGLLFAGGDAVFGEGKDGATNGYRRTELERLLPITFERKDEPEVALVIILDRSWSMAGDVMELCKTAAQAAVDVLPDEQTVGILTFNDRMNWDVTPRNVGKNRDMIRRAISAIEPDGHTLIYPAVEAAYLTLERTKARAKHVVLLSDGRPSRKNDYQPLVNNMVAARMTVTTVALGPGADIELLTNIAKWGKGRSYVVDDAKEVPQIFVKEAQNAATPAFDEGTDILPIVKTRSFLKDVDLTRMPALRGRTAMVARDGATQILTTEMEDPLLAFWPIGLGRTAAFASDVKDRWASAWVGWRGYGPFFAATVRSLVRQRSPELAVDVNRSPVQGNRQSLAVSLEARDASGAYRDLLKPVVHLESAGGRKADVTARQVAPGRYQANITTAADELLTVSVSPAAGQPGVSRLVVPDQHAEYRFRPPDASLLESVAIATGGGVGASAEKIQSAVSAHPTARRALWPALVLAALGLWLVDVLLRRIRVFEK